MLKTTLMKKKTRVPTAAAQTVNIAGHLLSFVVLIGQLVLDFGRFMRLDKRTGKVVWEHNVGSQLYSAERL